MSTRLKPGIALLMLALLGVSGTATAVSAETDLRATLFAQTDEALRAANEAKANVLAPKNYADAAEHYRDAEASLARGGSLESIKKDLDAAASSLRKAVEATRLANVTFASTIQARNDAEEVNAKSFAPEPWQDAEEKFASAARRLEDGDVNGARSRGVDADNLFRAAELAAIKANYLDETKRLIEQADDEKVKRYAPKTLANAKALLAQAEKALTQNRYDTDEPRSLARQAKYQVKHAIYLAQALKPVRDKKLSLEDFALSSEKPIEQIAGTLDLVAELDQGYAGPTQEILAKIDVLQKGAYELSESRSQILALEEEIQRLEGQLGTQSQRLAAQEEQRRRVRQVEATFGPDEAQIFTQGRNVLIRPVGLIFATGSDQIPTRYFDILRKVQDAVRVFPDSNIVVEGHTDSFGSDETNLGLSENRAKAVRAYLLANMRDLTDADVQAVGFGESRPVANNETPEGRAKNRRIDLVIRPKADIAAADME
jgi:outer membrane protein OmpA-like peptidoglycan-associated protein